MSDPQKTDRNLTDQTISHEPHSEQDFEDRGPRDAVGGEPAAMPTSTEPEATYRSETPEARARERAEGNQEGAKQPAKAGLAASAMFFPVVILAIIAVVVILFFVL